MKCYYETLGIERTATSDEIKKAHRKLALRWHPDKNKDSPEEAHKVYQVIQEAYDCLSDPQEKAFYDKHRVQILMGGSDHKSDDINVMAFYGSSCYERFNDQATGFYGVYSDLFTKITQEDERYVEGSVMGDVPLFGHSNSDFEDVKLFYGWWQSYCTKKSYMWLDELYDVRQADGRRILRAMEKENKKLVDEAKKEFNESVRSLVTHIKKKDPRCIAQKEKQKLLDEQRLAAEKKRKEEHRRKRAEEIERITQQEQEMIAEHEQQLDGLLNEFSDSDEDEDPFYCPLCRKLFKSDKMMKQHEKSKKHKEKLSELEGEFAAELEEAGLTEKPTTEVTATSKKKKKKKNRRQHLSSDEDPYDIAELEPEGPPSLEQLSDVLRECTVREQEQVSDEQEQTSREQEQVSDEQEQTSREQEQASCEQEQASGEQEQASGEQEQASGEQEQALCEQEHTLDNHNPIQNHTALGDDNHEQHTRGCHLDTEEYSIINTAPPTIPHTATGPKKTACNMCGEEFQSKTKLFTHLQETGHAIKKEFVPKVDDVRTGGKTKSRKGKRR